MEVTGIMGGGNIGIMGGGNIGIMGGGNIGSWVEVT